MSRIQLETLLSKLEVPKLSGEFSHKIEGELNYDDFLEAVKWLKNGKSLGWAGLRGNSENSFGMI